MEVNRCDDRDLLPWVGHDNAGRIFRLLHDPADLVNAAAVSCSWRQFVIEQESCPEIATFSRALFHGSADEAATEPANCRKREEHKIWAYISRSIIHSPPQTDGNCIKLCIGASSTHSFPRWSMENTLQPQDQVNLVPSYWSSDGHDDPNLPESLIYKLSSPLCIIHEIRIKPFEGYSCERVRIRMGHHTRGYSYTNFVTDDDENLRAITDANYVWTYTSLEFPMEKIIINRLGLNVPLLTMPENVLQSFILPRPALCIGGVLKIELLQRMQRHIRIYHAQVIGRSLSTTSMADVFGPPR